MIPIRDNIPTRRFPYVNYSLLVVNVVVFIWQLIVGLDASIVGFGLIPYNVVGYFSGFVTADAAWIPFFSAMFLHGGFMHLAFNMLFLHIFGDNVEDYFGHVLYIAFYAFCGLFAATAHFAFNYNSTLPMVGASGAIAGVMGAYMLLYPSAKVRVLLWVLFFVTTVDLPAFLFLGLWFLIQLYSGWGGGVGGGVAWWAHIGGFVAGVGWVLLFRRFKPPPRKPLRMAGFRKRDFH